MKDIHRDIVRCAMQGMSQQHRKAFAQLLNQAYVVGMMKYQPNQPIDWQAEADAHHKFLKEVGLQCPTS